MNAMMTGLDGFEKSLYPFPMNECNLSIERVKEKGSYQLLHIQ